MVIETVAEGVLELYAVILNRYELFRLRPVKVVAVVEGLKVLIFFTLPNDAVREMDVTLPAGKASQVT